ncbi:MAG: hypothetical protein DA328_05940 [Nitrososphaeraceae archaeon]|nr:hypothetical protein [Nitrososphaeraceae archaeon]
MLLALFSMQVYTVDMAQAEEKDPLTNISIIRQLLNLTLFEYNNMNYTGASDLVDIAYIDNFEFIEEPLEKQDEELMETTEEMIREKLSGLIDDKSSYSEVESLVNQIEENLNKAEVLLNKDN